MATMGSGAADGLQQVLQQKFLELQQRQRIREFNETMARQAQIDADNTRFRDADLQLRRQAAERLAAQDKRETADADAARAETTRIAGLRTRYQTDPNAFAGLNPTQRRLALAEVGIHNLGQHDPILESPDDHAAHVKADAGAAWESRKRELDYLEQQRRSRPMLSGRLVKDDPAFPIGVQTHLAQIRSRHPDFESALTEFVGSIDSHRQAHPAFQPEQAVNALRQFYSGGGAPPRTTRGAPMVGADGRLVTTPSPGAGGGRGAAPSRPNQPAPPQADASGEGRTLTAAALADIARKHGITTEQARAKAEALGYIVQ